MLNWKAYLGNLKDRISTIAGLNPDAVKGYAMISNAKPQHPVLDAKTRELISLAVAVTVRCDGCIVVHTDSAKRMGATENEIAEALGVAIAINAGAALVYSARVMDAYETL